MRINESSFVCQFWESYVTWSWIEIPKNIKKRQFLTWKFINSSITQKSLKVQRWNSNTRWVLMNALRKPSLEVPGHVTIIVQAENVKKLTNLNQYISVMTDIDEKWFVILELTINQLSFDYVRLAQLGNYFSCSVIFFLTFCFLFFFLLPLCTFKPLNALYSKFERLKISGRNSVQLKWGCQVDRIPLNRVLQKFELLNRYS